MQDRPLRLVFKTVALLIPSDTPPNALSRCSFSYREALHMRSLTRYAVSISAAAALLSGCGASQTAIPAQALLPTQTLMDRGPQFKVLYHFNIHGDGTHPIAGLINVNGTLYGTTLEGGSSNRGTVYRVSTNGSEKVLHSFVGGSDGSLPVAGLVDVHGTLYGATDSGGSFGNGTVYSISKTGTEKVLRSFRGGADGANPDATLINVNGMLYGTTAHGGSGCGSVGCGTLYRVSTTGSQRVIYRFKGGSGGANMPQSRLLNVNGTLYGTTYLGGSRGCDYDNGCGTVFSITTGGKENWLYSFAGSPHGWYPLAGLVNVDGTLYGTTTQGGGSLYFGIFYSVSTDGSEKMLHRFKWDYADYGGGWDPQTSLIDVNGTLYGTTADGGSFGDYGTIYSMSRTGSVNFLHDFRGADGSLPQGDLIYVNGTLYGTTFYGGRRGKRSCCGTVFALTL